MSKAPCNRGRETGKKTKLWRPQTSARQTLVSCFRSVLALFKAFLLFSTGTLIMGVLMLELATIRISLSLEDWCWLSLKCDVNDNDGHKRCECEGLLPGDSQSDVHLSSAREVEGVEGHLGGGLAYGLSCQQAHSFPRVAQGALPLIVKQLPQPAIIHYCTSLSCFYSRGETIKQESNSSCTEQSGRLCQKNIIPIY